MTTSPSPAFTAFAGQSRIAAGPLAEVARAVRTANDGLTDSLLVFDDATGKVVDLDLRGTADEVATRYALANNAEAKPRGRGRPKLGVVAREVTLLPRHWDWLAAQPGGASVALRRLVEEARRADAPRQQTRAAQEAAYRFMSAMAGNLPGFEETSRALFAGDRLRMEQETAGWPDDIRVYALELAFPEPADA
ncbi:hypothetical protein GCM10007301_00380 [Azorhizobium oxalatiphilum]|uniref:DUF2239 family protein n=1 Tax=Azorhizobium oxalatiphilum TaxID=980631 RepID=A0A917BL07_9HYPH|nr:DUF2239 family protein [Azorhizobium oxalatiphilum]GGF44775.1 hypothetical protein GCM10007301_00380 [Azorhizobium oxalatiphilum]